MEIENGILHVDTFLTVTLAIIVLFVGKRLNSTVSFLREFSIPEPVSGGLLFSVLFTLVYFITDVGVEFELVARDVLLEPGGNLRVLRSQPTVPVAGCSFDPARRVASQHLDDGRTPRHPRNGSVVVGRSECASRPSRGLDKKPQSML